MWAPLYFRQGGVLIYRLDGFLCLTTNLQWRVPLLLKWKWSSEWVYIKMRSDSSSSVLPFSLALIFPLPLFPSFSFLSLSCSLARLPWFLYRPICTAESLSSLFFLLDGWRSICPLGFTAFKLLKRLLLKSTLDLTTIFMMYHCFGFHFTRQCLHTLHLKQLIMLTFQSVHLTKRLRDTEADRCVSPLVCLKNIIAMPFIPSASFVSVSLHSSNSIFSTAKSQHYATRV